ncbi:amylo-alpha-1,6-glucosidase [Micromonospora sp. AMSO12t]|uniref:amylo-alpha-1,6-glucosidase n=1 Tax=unclassified Micromonospora TaxID=2617518 RepID=UPI00124B5204|nr:MULTISPECIES: glycogen debranching N-terminal domain-containing protein [unclassified Micromonospora]KAB1158773.1 amylo-alpha-1,6-glucosidase [Micromonospora sp. AMSO12t]WSG05634.1 amylo-alpha-1,6-glucosidase [Micromonospora sp. NBC_01740]
MPGTVSCIDGSTFIVSDSSGDVESSPATPVGLFAADSRFLSRWVLTVNGERLTALSVDDSQYYEAAFFVVPGGQTDYVEADVSAIRRRRIGPDLTESLTLFNYGEKEMDLDVRLEVAADFADIFDIKFDVRQKAGSHYLHVGPDELRLGYRRGTFQREVSVSASEPADFDRDGLRFTLRLPPGARWSTELRVVMRALRPDGVDLRASVRALRPDAATLPTSVREWLAEAPKLDTDSSALQQVYHRSLVDLAALRFAPLSLGGAAVPAAGLPWFMTLFGRDSLLTCLQTLPFTPSLTPPTLRILASLQGARTDNVLEEDPGRILHELRYGESAAFEEQPHSPYYGTVDASPLFVVLLDEYERWSGDAALVMELEQEARAALAWIDQYADLTSTGYLWYERRNRVTGLENQCWKDSWDSISYADGRLPGFPRATCEAQGYAYDAKIRAARLARTFWNDPAYADRLESEAAALYERFNRDFWLDDRGYYALALDRDGTPVDSLSSNIGHLLWSGIVPPERAGRVAEHLMGPALYSGWGVRTLAEGQGRYNPLGYHRGTVWPFDNSFIAWGLRRYGFADEAGRIAEGVIDAATYFQGRLPEAFGGFDRHTTRYPVRYPTAGSPQAWSSGASLLLIRIMLGIEPHEDHLAVNPALPPGLDRLALLDIPGRWGRADAFARHRFDQPRTNGGGADPGLS